MFLAEKRDSAFFACALMLATHFKMGKWDEQHGKKANAHSTPCSFEPSTFCIPSGFGPAP